MQWRGYWCKASLHNKAVGMWQELLRQGGYLRVWAQQLDGSLTLRHHLLQCVPPVPRLASQICLVCLFRLCRAPALFAAPSSTTPQPEREGCYTVADVRRTRPQSSLLFNTMFNLHKFMAFENRDPFALRAEQLGEEGQVGEGSGTTGAGGGGRRGHNRQGGGEVSACWGGWGGLGRKAGGCNTASCASSSVDAWLTRSCCAVLPCVLSYCCMCVLLPCSCCRTGTALHAASICGWQWRRSQRTCRSAGVKGGRGRHRGQNQGLERGRVKDAVAAQSASCTGTERRVLCRNAAASCR